MSRAGYSDDLDHWSMIRWRGAVTSALRGKKGQAFLQEALAALDALPEKRLITNDLRAGCEVCTLGAVAAARALPLADVDPEDNERVAGLFGIPDALAREIMFENDEGFSRHYPETPEGRWERMREWIASLIKKDSQS